MLYKSPFIAPNTINYSFGAIKDLLPKNSDKVLEVGCGLGGFAFNYLKEESPTKYLGVDISGQLVDFLNKNYIKYHKGLRFECLDFCDENLTMKDSFDFFYSSDVLEHLEKPEEFIQNIHKHLTPNGVAIINFPNVESHGINQYLTADSLFKQLQDFYDVKLFKLDIVDSIFVEKGYKILRSIYDLLFRRKFAKQRKKLYEKVNEDEYMFEETSAFSFAKSSLGIKNDLACFMGNVMNVFKPKYIYSSINKGEQILNYERIVVVAKKSWKGNSY